MVQGKRGLPGPLARGQPDQRTSPALTMLRTPGGQVKAIRSPLDQCARAQRKA